MVFLCTVIQNPIFRKCTLHRDFASPHSLQSKPFAPMTDTCSLVMSLTLTQLRRQRFISKILQKKTRIGQLTPIAPWPVSAHPRGSSLHARHLLVHRTVSHKSDWVVCRETRFVLLTAKPQRATRPRKQKSAPSARALKMSVPRRMPPSIPILICPLATGAHSASASMVAGTPSSCRPPWFEMMTPSSP